MKNLFVLALVVVLSVTVASAQLSVNTNGVRAEFKWLTAEKQDIGKIEQGKPVVITYEFLNTSKVPLIISNVKASCGCTDPQFPKTPIAPNQKGYVKATFNAAAAGTFDKTLTVISNAITEEKVLEFKGEVVSKGKN